MKMTGKALLAAMLILLVLLCSFALADVAVNAKNFPDAAFRKVVKTFDINGDGKLSDSEIEKVTSISCENSGISSLKGIENFSKLEGLHCSGNSLTSLDLSGNPSLWVLECGNNQLSALNVGCCPRMNLLYCDGNRLTSLNLAKNPCMEWLRCEDNRIASLDLSKCPDIIYAICSNNNMNTLTLKNNSRLCILYAYGNRYSTVDVSTCGLLDWAVKHGRQEGSCNYTGWVVDNPPFELAGSSQILFYLPSMTKVITRTDVSAITLNKAKATLTRTASAQKPVLKLTASISPADASVRSVEWSSSNPKVAKVDKKGKVTALKPGTAVITCKAKDGSGTKATCKITVKNKPVSKIRLNKSSILLKKQKTYQLAVLSIQPADAFSKAVKWSSSNKKVATVDRNGLVTVVGKGTCVITCAAKDGSGKKAVCEVTVK